MTLERINIDDPRWLAFLETRPDALIFHHPRWVNLVSSTYGYRSFILVEQGGNQSICAGLPVVDVNSRLTGHRWAALPFTDYLYPLAVGQPPAEQLTDHLLGLQCTGQMPGLEVRWALPERQGIQSVSNHVIHTLCLDAHPEQIFKNIKKGHRYSTRKAESAGLTVERTASWAGAAAFYNLHLLTRRRLGVPVQPLAFFKRLWQDILSTGLGFVSLVKLRDQTVAAAIFLTYHNTITYKYSASDTAYWSMYPNNLLLMDAIQWAAAQGYQRFDFGSSDADNGGLRSFKRGWGAEEVPLYYAYIGKPPAKAKNGLVSKTMNFVIRNSPPTLCRAAGELLYKHFG